MGRAGLRASGTPVAVGDLAEDRLARTHAVELATPCPFGEHGPFVLAEQPLDLDQQAGLGVAVDGRGVGEADVDTEAGELVADQDLVGEVAGKPVG
jgi:hypothetical protein